MVEKNIQKIIKKNDQKLLLQLVLKKQEINFKNLLKTGTLEIMRKDPASLVSKADALYEELMICIRNNEPDETILFYIFSLNEAQEEINHDVTHALDYSDDY